MVGRDAEAGSIAVAIRGPGSQNRHVPTTLLYRLAGCVLAFSIAGSSLAAAQDDDPRVSSARATFEQAEADYAAGRFLDAAAGYERSYALLVEVGRDTAPLVLFNIGSAYDRAGRAAEARAAYQRFVDEARPDLPGIGDRIEQARARIVVLGPGPATVAPTAAAPASSAPAESGGGGISPVGPIVLAAGGVLVITGLIVGGVALGRDGDLGVACPSRQSCPAALRPEYDEIRALALAGDVLWIGGAVAAAAGLVLTLALPGDDGGATASLGCGPTGCQARLAGTFR